MKKGLLSIVMVSYNHGQYLKEAIQSVISQTYKNWELIIVDDGSPDNSREIATEYTAVFPGQIRLFTHKNTENLGIAASYMLGLSLCQGEFIGFLEPDDIWTDINAETKISALLKNNAGLVYSNVNPIGEPKAISMRNSCLRIFPTAPANVPFEAFTRLLVINFLPSFSTVIAKRSVLQNLKFISSRKYAIWLDWFLWIQASRKAKLLFLPQKLVSWRLYNTSYCNQFILKEGKIKLIIFELKYRHMLFKELVLAHKGSIYERMDLLYLFGIAFIKRFLVFLKTVVINKIRPQKNYSNFYSKCLICGRNASLKFVETYNKYSIYECPLCNGQFVLPMKGENYDLLYKGMGKSGFTYEKHIYFSPEKYILIYKICPYAQAVLKILEKYRLTGKMLDIGCSQGAFSKMAADKGFDVFAIDPAEEAIRYAKQNYGIKNALNCTIDKIPDNWTNFDVIVSLEVIEHIENPRLLIDKAFKLLKPGGYFILSTPNNRSIEVKCNKRPIGDYPPHHLSRYCIKTIKFLFEKEGFDIINIFTNPVDRFAIGNILFPGFMVQLALDKEMAMPVNILSFFPKLFLPNNGSSILAFARKPDMVNPKSCIRNG